MPKEADAAGYLLPINPFHYIVLIFEAKSTGMFGNMKDMMGKLQEAQKQAEEIKSRLDTVHLKEGDEEIMVTITGNREIKDIEIDDRLLQDKEELQDKLVLTLNRAIAKANKTNEEEMQGAAKGMLPGMDMFK